MKNLDLEKLRDLKSFYDKFNNESSRGMVIIAFANLEAYVQKLLEYHYRCNPLEIKNLFDLNLSSYIEKIKLAYSLKIIKKPLFQDLDLIRQIRNKFAHELYDLSFEDNSIVSLCEKLKSGNVLIHNKAPNPENKFKFSCWELQTRLALLLEESERELPEK